MRRRTRRALLGLGLGLAVIGCGGRLTPPTVPGERAELDRLQRAQAEGAALDVAERRRLALLLDRVDNAPARADLLDAASSDLRARQAWAWRGWARQTADWPDRVLAVAGEGPTDPGGAALLVLLHRAPLPRPILRSLVPKLQALRATLRPVSRCLVDAVLAEAAMRPVIICPEDDARAALAELAASRDEGSAAPPTDPEAARLRWTLAMWGPAPVPSVAAEVVAGWVEAWPRHADARAMLGATAAADFTAPPEERLAEAGAAWFAAIAHDPQSVRARLALAALEAAHGFPEAAEAHRLRARQVSPDPPGGLDEGWAAPRTPPTPPAVAGDLLPKRTTWILTERSLDPAVVDETRLLDYTVLVVGPDGALRWTRQRVQRAPFAFAPGCVARPFGPLEDPVFQELCVDQPTPVGGAIELPFPLDRPVARAEIKVRAPIGAAPGFESLGGAPGARVYEAPPAVTYTFELEGLDPVIDGRRRPRVRVRTGPPTPAASTLALPEPGVIDRLAAQRSADPRETLGALDPPDAARGVVRLRLAGVDAEWLRAAPPDAAEGAAAVDLVALPAAGDWRVVDAAGRPISAPHRVIAATRAALVGRTVGPRDPAPSPKP